MEGDTLYRVTYGPPKSSSAHGKYLIEVRYLHMYTFKGPNAYICRYFLTLPTGT